MTRFNFSKRQLLGAAFFAVTAWFAFFLSATGVLVWTSDEKWTSESLTASSIAIATFNKQPKVSKCVYFTGVGIRTFEEIYDASIIDIKKKYCDRFIPL